MRLIDADAVCERCKASGAICTGKDCEIPTMPTLTPPNEPLTFAELEEMGGQPVWLEPLQWWALVNSPNGLHRVIFRLSGGGWRAYYSDEELQNDGLTIYRRPPEGEEDA